MKLRTEIVPLEDQRYSTLGDYYQESDGTWVIKITDTGNSLYNQLILFHEITELILILRKGLTEQEITDFDIANSHLDEPGESIEAPYHLEHKAAEDLEFMLCQYLKLSWTKYNKHINKIIP